MVKFCGTPVGVTRACPSITSYSSRGGQSILGLQMPGNLKPSGLAGLVASAVTNLEAGDGLRIQEPGALVGHGAEPHQLVQGVGTEHKSLIRSATVAVWMRALTAALQPGLYCLASPGATPHPGASTRSTCQRSCPGRAMSGPAVARPRRAWAAMPPGLPARLSSGTPRPAWPCGRPPTSRNGDRPVATHPMVVGARSGATRRLVLASARLAGEPPAKEPNRCPLLPPHPRRTGRRRGR
jgi:hypothetical protein